MFVKISLVVVVSILITNSMAILFSNFVTEKLFVESSTFMNGKVMNEVILKIEEFHSEQLSIINSLEKNVALRKYYMSPPKNQKEIFTTIYQVNRNFEINKRMDRLPSVVTISNDGVEFVFSGEKPFYQQEKMSLPDINKETISSKKIRYEGITSDSKEQSYIVATRKLFHPYSGDSFGQAYISTSEEEFYQLFERAAPQQSNMVILGSDGKIVSNNQKELVGEYDIELLNIAKDIKKHESIYETLVHNNRLSIVVSEYIPELDMYMVNLIDKDILLSEYVKAQKVIIIIEVMIAVLAVILVFFITRKITSPMLFLIKQLEKFKGKKFEKIPDINGNYEVAEMQEVYNSMVEEIDNYVERLVNEQEQRRKLEIEALQMQINPHFIYNTLASIKYLSWQNDSHKVNDTINALISILRKTIGDMEEEITAGEEIDILKQYVYINQIRFGEQIQVQYYITDDCKLCLVPKLYLQPFIENAFFHAFQEKKEGQIRIFMKRQNEDLICEVIDEGDGMTQEALEHLLVEDNHHHLTGIGIPNVQERIKIMYGEKYGIHIHSVYGKGTAITIRMPYHTKE